MTRRCSLKIWVWLVIPPVLTSLACGVGIFGAPTNTPTPTPAPPLPPIIEPTVAPPTAAGPGILYEDSFTDPSSGWPTITTDTTKAGYHPPDAFHLEVSAPNTVFWTFREQNFDDFSAELTVFADRAGDTGQWRHGLAFRQTAEGQFYAFVVNPRAKTWQVLKRTSDAWQTLAEASDPTIVAELKAPNTLRVDAQGANFTFSVNGHGVAAVNDGEYASGDFGFVVETSDQTLAHIHFDSLIVHQFDAASVPPVPTAGATPELSPTPTETPTPTAAAGGQEPEATLDATALLATAGFLGTVVAPGSVPVLPSDLTAACAIPGVPCP